MELKIKEPIWKYKAVGIHPKYIGTDLDIEILYTDKHKMRTFPHKYFLLKGKLEIYPLMSFGSLKVYVVPIKDLDIKQ